MRRAAATLFLVGITACFSEEPEISEPDPDVDAVVIEMTSQLSFQPQHVQVSAGQVIRWRNASNSPHSSTGDPDLADNPASVDLPPGATPWHSGTLATGATFDLVLTEPGDYRYFCVPHESAAMIGTITVVP